MSEDQRSTNQASRDRSLDEQLLAWYDQRKRDLPWRRTKDAYAIWLSEIMLQQTRVETVIPYFESFLEDFPTVASLAAADEEEVLAAWSGLGYYRRARFLHRAAKQVVRSGGDLPQTIEGWKELPGIGDYTAAAISSIAFGVAEPVLDGNVERVMSRLYLRGGNLRTAAAKRELRDLARTFVNAERAGDSNQALMELGATVCLPVGARCGLCPLSENCLARQQDRVADFPEKRDKKAPEKRTFVAAVASREGRYLLFRRSSSETLLADTWEIPWVDITDNQESAPHEVEARLARDYGGQWVLGQSLGKVKHSITYRQIEVRLFRAELQAGSSAARLGEGYSTPGESEAKPQGGRVGRIAEGREAAWLTLGQIKRRPTSSLVGKILRREKAIGVSSVAETGS